jgi:hypothetical protein
VQLWLEASYKDDKEEIVGEPVTEINGHTLAWFDANNGKKFCPALTVITLMD